MSELSKYLQEQGIDQIEDDEEFCREEYAAVHQYCKEKNFELSKDDLQEIINRGIDYSFEIWKDCNT